MSLLTIVQWLEASSWSILLRESQYAYPIVESIHVWALCLFFGMVVLFDLRLLGWTMRRVPASEVIQRLMPWTIAGFVIMVISGALLFFALPLKSYHNVFFRLKMVMLVLAGVNAFIFHSGVYRRVATWELDATTPRQARVAGAISLVLWVTIIFSGRLIAYNWFDCDMQPQPSIINSIAGCVPAESDN